MKILGIDLGSREVKMVISENGNFLYKNKISTMKFYRDYCYFDGKVNINFDKLNIGEFNKIVSTGYGKNNTDIRFTTPINELKAHAYGALVQSKLTDFILLDIGGQDVKIIKIEKGVITDLDLNEKCAASCGRFLENMANILEVDLDELAKYGDNPIHLNSTCSVFSESELIGKIAEGITLDRLCAGVNYSLYNRLKPFFNKFSGDTLVLSGGVSKNTSIQRYLHNDYNNIIVLEDAQFNGAIGCCYYGERMINNG